MKKWLVSVSLFLLVLAGCAQQTKQENEVITIQEDSSQKKNDCKEEVTQEN